MREKKLPVLFEVLRWLQRPQRRQQCQASCRDRPACHERDRHIVAATGDILAAGAPDIATCRGWARTASKVGMSGSAGLWMDL